MAERMCAACGLAPAAGRSRYCVLVECGRERARLRKRKSVGQVVEFPAPVASSDDGSVFGSTLKALEAAQRTGTPDARAALVLAQRLDHAQFETGASLASVSREFRASLEAALKDAPRAGDGVDELRLRRAKRFGVGS